MRRYEKGESSKKASESDENERPLKKAKYVWQLKGKYHLKDQYKYSTNKNNQQSHHNHNNHHQNDITSNINLHSVHQGSILEKNDLIHQNILKPKENPEEKCTKCINNLLTHSNNFLADDLSDQEDIPVTMVRPKRENHDDFLQKWQTRQVAKSFLDNTINTILEQWKLAPTEANDFMENCEDNNGQVEDEGIMMAIQSHGLQSGMSRSFSDSHNLNILNNLNRNNHLDDYQQESKENFRNKRFEGLDKERKVIKKEDCDDLEVGSDDLGEGNEIEDVETDQVEFLSTAVSMAIQNKGLSSYSYG